MKIGKPISFIALFGLALAAALGEYLLEPVPARSVHAGGQFSELDSDKPDPLRVLFVGNSFTFFGPLPEVFGKLVQAGAPERGLKVRMVAFPGIRLVDHEQNGKAAQAIAHDGPWDYVVLQDQSRMAWNDPVAMRLATQRLDARVRAAGARSILFATWAEANETTREQGVISEAYDGLGAELGARVAPVGRAWLQARELRPKLYAPDGHHPSALGVYMTACVFYGVLLGKSPQGLPYPTTAGEMATADEVRAVQRAAARATGTLVE